MKIDNPANFVEFTKFIVRFGAEDDPEVFDFITAKAMEYKLGARGLRSICESLFTQAMFELPGTDTKVFNVTLAYAKDMFDKSKISALKVA